jgi:MFS family permease
MLLRRPSLLALLAAEIVSTTGSQMTWLALPWFVLTTTGSPTRMGIVMAAELLPVALLGIPSGSVAARLGARRTMLVSDLARAPLMASVPALHYAGLLSFPVLLGLVFLLGVFFAPYFSSQRVILPELVGEDETLLAQANAIFQGATRLTMLLGPALAGVLIALLGAAPLLFVDAATFLVSFLIVVLLVPGKGRPVQTDDSRGVLAGARFLLRDRLLGPLVGTSALMEMAFQALFVAVPVLAYTRYGGDARIAGWLFAAWGAGAVAGSFAAYRVVRRYPPLVLASVATVAQALPLWLLAGGLPLVGIGAALVVSGVFNSLSNAPMFAVLTARVPESLRAKTMTAAMTLTMLAGPLGLAAAGPALERLGTRPVFLAIAGLATASALGFATIALRYARPWSARELAASGGAPRG